MILLVKALIMYIYAHTYIYIYVYICIYILLYTIYIYTIYITDSTPPRKNTGVFESFGRFIIVLLD